MSAEFLDEVRRLAKQFFDLPMEEKSKYSREENEIEGYGNDMILSNQQILDWTDRLYLTVYPKESHRFKYWPTNPERFRYFSQTLTIFRRICRNELIFVMNNAGKFFTSTLQM